LALLEENIPTEKELQAREELFKRILRMREEVPQSNGPFPTAEEMIREDRER
jgi:hypothetical protein